METTTIAAEQPEEAHAGRAPNRASDAVVRAFIDSVARDCPHFMGDDLAHYTDGKITPKTLLARIIHAAEYTPSTVDILADPKLLTRRGFIIDADLSRMSLREMTDHCSKPMLDELATHLRAREASLVELLAEPSSSPAPTQPAAVPERRTAIVNDEMLGRIEIDVDTAAVIRVVPDSDSNGEILVDDAAQVQVNADTETAKQSKIWGSW
jgi:hypothetical protein